MREPRPPPEPLIPEGDPSTAAGVLHDAQRAEGIPGMLSPKEPEDEIVFEDPLADLENEEDDWVRPARTHARTKPCSRVDLIKCEIFFEKRTLQAVLAAFSSMCFGKF